MNEAVRAQRDAEAAERGRVRPWPLSRARPPRDVADSDWRDWGWQMRNRIRTAADLRRYVEPSADEAAAIEALATRFRFVITPYYASLMDPADPDCPIRRQVVPQLPSSRIRRDSPIPSLRSPIHR